MADYSNPKASNAILGDLQEIVALIQSGAKMDPTGNTNIPNGAKRVVAVTGGYQIQSYNGTTWVSIGKLMHDCDSVDGKSPNTGAAAGTIPVRDNKGQLPGDITGNAGTATKLATARTIDLGGILSATEQSFDGSKPITIPVNSVNVNNEQDNALVGEVSKLHGGTGRTDGAAADVVVNSAAGQVLASDYGQIGDAINKTGTDLDTLTVTGNYLFRGGTVENHFPWDIPEASLTLVEVFRAGVHVFQTLTYSSGQQWMRRSANTGGEWLPWVPVQGQYGQQNAHVSIYISKSGSDDNTGLDSAYPVLTINRALEVARGIVPSRGTYGVKFCIGEGDWDNVSFESLPFNLRIYPYDGNAPTQYSDSLPTFTGLYVISSDVWVEGIVVNGPLTATRGANVIVQAYNKAAVWQAHYGGTLQIDASTAPIETGAISNQQFVFRSYNGGVLTIAGTRTLSVVENLNLSAGFLSMDRGGFFNGVDLISCETATDVTVTGKKYALLRGSCVTCDKSWLDTFPGSQAGTLETGSKIRTAIWGGGDAHTFMAADATWKKDSSSIYARDVAVGGNTDDLASARGQIGNNYRLPDDVDLNDITTPGFYGVRGVTATNVPGSSWYALWVMNGYGSTCSQLAVAVSVANPHMYLRSWDGSSWCPWTEINTNESPYAIFTGATASAAGAKGLVPAPAAGDNNQFLRGDGSWHYVEQVYKAAIAEGAYQDVVSATGSDGGRSGVIRINHYADYNEMLLGVCGQNNSAPNGITLQRSLEDNSLSINIPGNVSFTGEVNFTNVVNGSGVFAPGDFVWSYRSSKTGFLLCNGAAVSRTTYADLYAVIGTKFGAGNGSTTFNLPDMRGRMAQGANGNLGTVLAAGLPNITGNVSTHTQIFSAGGAFGLGTGGNRADGGYGADHIRFNFDASRCSSIYGNSSTVQPPAIALNCFIKY